MAITTRARAEEKKDDGDHHHPSSGNGRRRPQSSSSSSADNDFDVDVDGGGVRNIKTTSTATTAVKNDEKDDRDASSRASGERRRRGGGGVGGGGGGGGSPLLLFVCAMGITSCYLWYGTVQERAFRSSAMDDDDGGGRRRESITLFLLATGTFSSFLLALSWMTIGKIVSSSSTSSSQRSGGDEDVVVVGIGKGTSSTSTSTSIGMGGGLDHPLIALTSLAYASAMSASNESLRYVSYPTCVLAKSSKLIPTIVVGWLADKWRRGSRSSSSRGLRREREGGGGDDIDDVRVGGGRHSRGIDAMEWIGACLITVGIVSFQFVQLRKGSGGDDRRQHEVGGFGNGDRGGDSPYGLALLGLSLLMDGLMAACQNALKRGRIGARGGEDGSSSHDNSEIVALDNASRSVTAGGDGATRQDVVEDVSRMTYRQLRDRMYELNVPIKKAWRKQDLVDWYANHLANIDDDAQSEKTKILTSSSAEPAAPAELADDGGVVVVPTWHRRPPSAMELMLYVNLYATMILLPASYFAGQFRRGMDATFSTDDVDGKSTMLLQLNLSASLGQVFVFLTIHHFSPLICTTITTTRKFFTILLSVYKFGHVLDAWQWFSVALVFVGLYVEIVAKLFEGEGRRDVAENVDVDDALGKKNERKRKEE